MIGLLFSLSFLQPVQQSWSEVRDDDVGTYVDMVAIMPHRVSIMANILTQIIGAIVGVFVDTVKPLYKDHLVRSLKLLCYRF